MSQELLDFLDFMYNEVLVDTDVFVAIRNHINTFYGTPPPGSFMDAYLQWYKGELGVPNE